MSALDPMARAARLANLEHRPMRQANFLDRFPPGQQAGVCFGVSAAYLVHHNPAANKLGLDFFQEIQERLVDPGGPLRYGPNLAFRRFISTNQRFQSPEAVPTGTVGRDIFGRGGIPVTQVFPGATQNNLMLMYGFWFRKTTDVPSEDLTDPMGGPDRRASYKALAELLARSPSYNIIHIFKHAMASYCTSKLGYIHFFDPNGGEVKTRFASNLARFFREYFHNETVSPMYLTGSGLRARAVQTLECRVDTYTP
jgi:hypothetical protein